MRNPDHLINTRESKMSHLLILRTSSIILSVLLLAATAACNDDNGGKTGDPCDPTAEGGECEEGSTCVAVAEDEGMCMEICDPETGEPCDAGETCYTYANGEHVCTPTCDPDDADACAEGWICAQVAGDDYICRPECELGSPACEDGEVCQPLPDGSAVCAAQCDPVNETGCSEGNVCELRTDGLYACYEPVRIRGMVFDSSSSDPIEGAHVIAADKTGASATDVAITDEAGMYELRVPVEREPDGALSEGVFTLRVSAADYLPYPHGIRPAIPVDAAQAEEQAESGWLLQNAATDVALIPLPSDQQGRGSISGSIVTTGENATPSGVLVVVEGGGDDAPLGFADKSGAYTVFNVPAGSWSVHGYKAFLQLDTVDVTLSDGEHKTGVDLVENDKPFGTLLGDINIVNAPGGAMTSVVIVPESTFSDTFVKGEVPPGLRAPPPPEDPSITGAFTIEGIPDGQYKVLVAFENDFLVRDPDPTIAGTDILDIEVPEGSSYDLDYTSDSFKVTEALVIISPGAEEPEPVTGTPTFIWEDDAGEDQYQIVVYNAFGDEMYRDDNLPRVTGGETVEVDYDGDALEAGMYYQFRVTSLKDGTPRSQTEDLLGVFFVPTT